MKLKRCACIEPLYSELPFYDRFQAAADDGFEFVEFWGWDETRFNRTCEQGTNVGHREFSVPVCIGPCYAI